MPGSSPARDGADQPAGGTAAASNDRTAIISRRHQPRDGSFPMSAAPTGFGKRLTWQQYPCLSSLHRKLLPSPMVRVEQSLGRTLSSAPPPPPPPPSLEGQARHGEDVKNVLVRAGPNMVLAYHVGDYQENCRQARARPASEQYGLSERAISESAHALTREKMSRNGRGWVRSETISSLPIAVLRQAGRKRVANREYMWRGMV